MKSFFSLNAYYLLLFTSFNWTFAQTESPQNPTLYPIEENGLYGFINEKGERTIPPSFHAVGLFSEGLAAARKEGLYGFIDKTGDYVIPPKYDYARKFEDGMAMVWLGSKPYFIDQSGRILFEHNFGELSYFEGNQLTKVRTKYGKYGMINRDWELIVDTAYFHIEEFSEGRAIVSDFYSNNNPYRVGVIDEEGNHIVHFDNFFRIKTYQDGYAEAMKSMTEEEKEKYNGKSPLQFIDLEGNIVLELSPNIFWSVGAFEKGEAIAYLEEFNDELQSSHVVINKKGDIIRAYSRPEPLQVIPFAENRLFQHLKDDPNGEDWKRSWRLTDESGKILCKEKFEEVLDVGLQNGVAFVRANDKWGVIDINGKYVFPLQFDYLDEESVRDGVFFYKKRAKVKFQNKTFKRALWGIANLKGEILVEPRFVRLNWVDTSHQIIFGGGVEKNFYMDSKGNSIWEHPRNWKFPAPIVKNVDYVSVSHCFLHFDEENNPKEARQFSYDDMTLEVQSSSLMENPILYVINQSPKTVAVEYKYSIANLKIQAKDKDGVWKDIEHILVPI